MNDLERSLARLKKKLLAATPRLKGADFALYVVSNAEMERLRRALRAGRDFRRAEGRKVAAEEIVNVLAFPEPTSQLFPHPEARGKKWLGEVYLNRSFARRAPGALPFLLVHGVLHLLGYRHAGLRDTMKMEALEKKLCRALGVPHGL